jgi:hypothetical protein
MTSISIQDGTKAGYRAKVDSNNRLHTLSTTKTINQQAGLDENTFNVNTGTINLTSSISAVLYLKNTSEKSNLIIPTIGYLLGNSTGGTGDLFASVFKNPSSGTIISEADPVAINQNKNLGGGRVLPALVYKGGDGETAIGGTEVYSSLLPSSARPYTIETGDIIIPPQTDIVIKVTPQTGNTSMNIQVFLAVRIEDIEL